MTVPKMKICVIGTRGFPDFIGGIETVCKNLYSELVKLDENIEIIVLTRNAQDIVHSINLDKQIKVKTIPTINLAGLENVAATFLSILYSLIFIRPNIIHLHGIGPGFFTLLARVTGKKVVVSNHAADYERPKWRKFGTWFLKTGEKAGVKYSHKMVCVSHAIQKELQNRFPRYASNVVTIRNGGSLPVFTKEPLELDYPENSYFLFVGRLEATKAVEDLMKAFAQTRTNKKLLIVGAEIDGNAYWDFLQTLSTPNIIFTGAKYGDELLALYKNAFALVHPSRMEGYCLVVAEAISVNTPVLLSDVPCHREFRLPEASFFKVGNIEQLSAKLACIDSQIFISQEAIDYQRANTWKVNASLHLDLYKSL